MSSRGHDLRARNSTLRPLVFLRALGCVDRSYRRLRSGLLQGLPAGDRRRLRVPPARHADLARHRVPQPATTSTSPRWGGSRARSTGCSAAGGCARRTRRFGLFLDEYGYQTRPPDRTAGVSLATQDRWLQKAAYRAWRDPRVKLLTQYQWLDEPLRRAGSPFAGWQSGLRFVSGKPKPALEHFDTPMQVDAARSRLWGQARPGGAQTVRVERRARGATAYRLLATVRTDCARLLDAEAATEPRRALPLQDGGRDERELASLSTRSASSSHSRWSARNRSA